MDSSGVKPETSRPLRVLELYSGIGGCSAALPPGTEVVAALDINEAALEVYRWNYPHPTLKNRNPQHGTSNPKLW